MSSELTESQETTRALWATGDYDAIAELTLDVGAAVVGAVSIGAGMRVLDVGTGTGSVAIAAAQAGADVVAVDIAPEHFDAARRRAADAGVEVEWLEGDAEALAFEDESFDRVLTAFGTISATQHDVAARELVRVCRSGGEVVMANWCPEALPARLETMLRRHRPAETLSTVSPSEWGTAGHVRRRVGGELVLAIEPGVVDIVAESTAALLACYEDSYGPLIVARREIDPQLYENLRRELAAWIEELDRGEREVRIPAPYLLVVGHKPVPDLRPNT